jgi:hypothetical protein
VRLLYESYKNALLSRLRLPRMVVVALPVVLLFVVSIVIIGLAADEVAIENAYGLLLVTVVVARCKKLRVEA